MTEWHELLDAHWSEVSFSPLHVEPTTAGHAFRVLVTVGAIPPEAVAVELFADAWQHGPIERIAMQRGDEVTHGTFGYTAEIDGPRPTGDYTPRVVAYHAEARFPADCGLIRWYPRPN